MFYGTHFEKCFFQPKDRVRYPTFSSWRYVYLSIYLSVCNGNISALF